MAEEAVYAGNGKHKTYPPPNDVTAWKPTYINDGSTERCESYDVEQWPKLEQLLREAIRTGFIGARKDGQPFLAADGQPKRAWAWVGATLYEIRFTGNGAYHAFPLTRADCWPSDQGRRLQDAPRWTP